MPMIVWPHPRELVVPIERRVQDLNGDIQGLGVYLLSSQSTTHITSCLVVSVPVLVSSAAELDPVSSHPRTLCQGDVCQSSRPRCPDNGNLLCALGIALSSVASLIPCSLVLNLILLPKPMASWHTAAPFGWDRSSFCTSGGIRRTLVVSRGSETPIRAAKTEHMIPGEPSYVSALVEGSAWVVWDVPATIAVLAFYVCALVILVHDPNWEWVF